MKTVGLPRMHKEKGEHRDFLPAFVKDLDRNGATRILIEEGYGSGMGLGAEDYLAVSSKSEEFFERAVARAEVSRWHQLRRQ